MTEVPGPGNDCFTAGGRADKGSIYARAGVGVYWVIHLVDRQVEVDTSPGGPTAQPAYGRRQDFRPGDPVTLTLDGSAVADVPVADLLP